MCTGRYSSRSAAHANAQAAPLGAGRADGAAARAADVAQVCLGPQTACTPGQPGVTLRNLTVGADGAVFNGPAAFLRPVGFAERAVFQRGMSARLEQLPPFERRVPLNAIPHGARPCDTPWRPVLWLVQSACAFAAGALQRAMSCMAAWSCMWRSCYLVSGVCRSAASCAAVSA